MIIREMFAKDINRPINGVIKVNQNEEDVIRQEVEEYVITKELKKHFTNFFDCYSKAFKTPTADIGVWISGFFGSGKSHFLKMLSYILENRTIDGIRTVEIFREKFADDPQTFKMIENSTKNETETILFNIDVVGPSEKEKETAVLLVFAKMFYNHIGYHGEDLKVVTLEKYLDKQGKMAEFCRVFRERNGNSWADMREDFAFIGDDVAYTLMEVLKISEDQAIRWLDDRSYIDFSVEKLVKDIKEYVDKKPPGYRLIFLADEVGQYVGTDRNMLLNLQSIEEELGSKCAGKVWLVCTGQEAIDEIIKVRTNEFSRIQARFKTRLSLSSSSVDEVIQKRILKKTDAAQQKLKDVYSKNDVALRNLFSFKDSVKDIKGYSNVADFTDNYPFVPYQFIVLQKVFDEIRKHGNSGAHLSTGARSMLSGFKEAAERIQRRDENALVPFFYFYDTVHSFLDSSIRDVIGRCERAAEKNDGVELYDVDVLKLLYLVRYVDDIPVNLDNIIIMMAEDIRTDKIALREKIQASLDRLLDQNYIGKNGEVYNFLTDEEQDVAKEIKNTQVDTTAIVNRLGSIIFNDIYPSKKYRYKNNTDFPYAQMVDDKTIGDIKGDMRLKFLTILTDAEEKEDIRLMGTSDEVVVVLSDAPYYEYLDKAMKIRKYIMQHNIQQMPKSKQTIIQGQQEYAAEYELAAKEALKKSIENGHFYVNGELKEIKGNDVKSKIDQAMEKLVEGVYRKLDLITKNAERDEDIVAILRGINPPLPGTEPNLDAVKDMEKYLEDRHMQKLPTSMGDIQSRYQSKPYGWKEIDIAAVAAQLIYDQKVTVKYSGETIQPNNPKLPDMLRKKNEINRTDISKRILVSAENAREAKNFLRKYFETMDVREDENGMIEFLLVKFDEQKEHYKELARRYEDHEYPDKLLVMEAIRLTEEVLNKRKDNIALIGQLIAKKDALIENKKRMEQVEGFFKNQVIIFDTAVKLENDLHHEVELGYFLESKKASDALKRIKQICIDNVKNHDFNYNHIPMLNDLMDTVNNGHNNLLDEKRKKVEETKLQDLLDIRAAAANEKNMDDIIRDADDYYGRIETQAEEIRSIALLDALLQRMQLQKNLLLGRIAESKKPLIAPDDLDRDKKKGYKSYDRTILFDAKRLESESDIDEYLETIRLKLIELLKNYDGIDLK